MPVTDANQFNPCAVIPVFNHYTQLPQVVEKLWACGLPVILVDDGSNTTTRETLAAIAARPNITCLHLATNQGKGAAVMTGIAQAQIQGYTHAVQVDADGQHDLGDVPSMLELARQHPGHLISGRPIYDHSVPAVRFYSRYLTHILVWLQTLSLSLRDSMCGFRVYPVAPTMALAWRVRIGRRMDFDTDIMVRLFWSGTPSHFIATGVHYPEDGVSHYRLWRDNLRMIWLHLRLLAGWVPRIPKLLARHLPRPASGHWANISERGTLAGLRFVGWADRLLGRRFCKLLLVPVIVYFMLVHGQARRASKKFLRAVDKRPSWANRFRQLMNFSECVLDKVSSWRTPDRIKMELDHCPPFIQDMTAGRGALMITAHLGNMEAARAFARQRPELVVNTLAHINNAAFINAMLRQANDDYSTRLFPADDIGPDTAMLLKQRIDQGEWVVMAGDRTPVDTHGRVTTVDFLGQPAPFAVGPYVLAHLLQCPVYLFFCLQEGDGYKMHIEPFAERITLPRKNRERTLTHWATQFTSRLGHYALNYPFQWYNFYDVWAVPTTVDKTGEHIE